MLIKWQFLCKPITLAVLISLKKSLSLLAHRNEMATWKTKMRFTSFCACLDRMADETFDFTSYKRR